MSNDDEPKFFSFEERQRQKACSRAQHKVRLARGRFRQWKLQRRNMPPRNSCPDRVALFRSKRTGLTGEISLERKPVPLRWV